MNIEELTQVFDGLARGLAAGLKEKEKKELAALVAMFRRFPNQSVSEFVKFVDGAFARENNSIPALVERIRACQQGVGETRQELENALAGIGAPDLKKVVAALGMKATAKKDESLKLIRSLLSDGRTDTPANSGSATDLAAEVDKAYAQYQAIEATLRTITVEEMRSRFAVLAALPKAILAGVLSKLGFQARGTKEEIEGKLLGNLLTLKISYDQTQPIGS